jgi:nitrile hydratase
MSPGHDHDRDHLLEHVPSDPALRVKALESVLVEKGLVDPAAVDAWIEAFEKRVGPHNGARVVARAWVDPANLVVCTLCSCYPWPLLGLPPRWYKAAPYRSRAVRDPRGVLREFGVELGTEVEVRVWDSTAELRYLVLPRRPDDSDGLGEDALAALVTRDSMIGAGLVPPASARKGP